MWPLLPHLLVLAAPASAQVWFVDDSATGANDGSSWTNAFTDLQSALAVVGWGQDVWVAEGTYRPSATLDRSASFVVPAHVDVYGGFAGTETHLSERAGLFATTVLTGDLSGDDAPGFAGRAENSYHVVTLAGGGVTRFDGFTIRGGNANSGSAYEQRGGGMRIEFPATSYVENCTFRENESGDGGGGVYSDFVLDTYRHCVFADNRAGGSGGAIWQDATQTAYATIENCRFHGNVARGDGGGALKLYYAYVVNCAFTGNSADGCTHGGGAILGYGYVVNSSIYGNHSAGAGIGGGGVLGSAGLNVENSILWGNFDDGGYDQEAQIGSLGGAYPDVRDCCVQGWDGTLGSGWVVSSDPRFTDADGVDDEVGTIDDDMRLRALSPCVDAAKRSHYWWAGGTTTDLGGNARWIDALLCDARHETLDMGALERPTIDGTTNHCPARDSSLGEPAILDAPCAPSVAANDLVIEASPVPAGMGVLVFGEGFERAPWGNGVLCVGGTLHATTPERTLGAILSFALDLDQPPGDAITAGSSWSFQIIYRDPLAGGAGFNLSDTVRCTFRP